MLNNGVSRIELYDCMMNRKCQWWREQSTVSWSEMKQSKVRSKGYTLFLLHPHIPLLLIRIGTQSSRFKVRFSSTLDQTEDFGCRDMKHHGAESFLKQENKNLQLPELASPLLLAHSHRRLVKGSDKPFHLGFVLFRPPSTLRSAASENKAMSFRDVPWRMCSYVSAVLLTFPIAAGVLI